MVVLIVIALSLIPNFILARGQCSASVQCANGQTFCSVESNSTGNSRERWKDFCGRRHPQDRFLSCWRQALNGGRSVTLDIICCDRDGNAVHSGWSTGGEVDSSSCAGI